MDLKVNHKHIEWFMLIYCCPSTYSHLPAGHQHYHNEENMSKACLQNYEGHQFNHEEI
jgi:hypothetical protein